VFAERRPSWSHQQATFPESRPFEQILPYPKVAASWVKQYDFRFIEGDASSDAVLRQAGLERARALIACADSDPENIFITLTARELRPDITIIARAALEDTESKLKRAGADRVISPTRPAAPRWRDSPCTRS